MLFMGTTEGLIMKPPERLLKIDSFHDANFAGMYGHEAMDDLICVKRRKQNWICDYGCQLSNYVAIQIATLDCSIYHGS